VTGGLRFSNDTGAAIVALASGGDGTIWAVTQNRPRRALTAMFSMVRQGATCVPGRRDRCSPRAPDTIRASQSPIMRCSR
jgi:hypothetical protein